MFTQNLVVKHKTLMHYMKNFESAEKKIHQSDTIT